MKIILVCAASPRDRDFWFQRICADGAVRSNGVPYRARLRALDVELRVEVIEREQDTDKLRGLNLAGVLNLEAVTDQACRSMIYARLRP